MHWPPRRILVGTDFSPSATAAARAAAALARRAGASLELVHVLPTAPPLLIGYEPLDALLLRRDDTASARARALALLEELARELAPERCHIHLPEGVAAIELLALRERLEIDLVALGAVGPARAAPLPARQRRRSHAAPPGLSAPAGARGAAVGRAQDRS